MEIQSCLKKFENVIKANVILEVVDTSSSKVIEAVLSSRVKGPYCADDSSEHHFIVVDVSK